MNPRTFDSSPNTPASPNDNQPVVIVATPTGQAVAALLWALRGKGLEVRRCRTEPEILDAFTDALLGHTARPKLLLIGSGLYRQIRVRIGALIRGLRWDVQVMVQLDDHPPGASPAPWTRNPVHTASAAVLPERVAHMAARQLADARLAALCSGDLRNWSAAEPGRDGRPIGEGP